VEDVFDQIAMDKQLAEEKGLTFGDDLKQHPETVPLQSDE